MFDNIASLRFGKGPNNEIQAQAMVSSEGETMDFRTAVTADGRVEDWMTNVLAEMRRTNRLITKEAVFYYCANNQTRLVERNNKKDKAWSVSVDYNARLNLTKF